MKRLALCLALLLSAGCMMHDEFVYEEVWYDVPAEEVHGCLPGPAYPTGSTSPRPVSLGPGIVPASGTIPPPPAPPQTREPDLLK